MRRHLLLCILAGCSFFGGCKPRQPATTVKHVSFGIYEILDCKTPGATLKTVRGDNSKKYCLVANPIVDESDVRGAEARRTQSGTGRLDLYFTIKTGQRMKETTERMTAEHHDGPARMAIVVDGVLVDVPELRGPISDSLVIEGAFSPEEAAQIADSLMGRR